MDITIILSKYYFHPAWLTLIYPAVVCGNRGEITWMNISKIWSNVQDTTSNSNHSNVN